MIEDEEDHAKVFEIGIAKSETGAECRTFKNGQSLFDELDNLDKTARPDLILLDLNLPDMDGFGILEKVRSVYPREQVPVVVFSSSSSQQDVASAYTVGASAYLVKPVSFEDTLNSLAIVCNYWLNQNAVVR